MPGATAVSSISNDDPAQRVGAFSGHQMWVTPYNPDERYAAGTYVTNNDGLRGLPEWTKANRSIENTDIVGWYTWASTTWFVWKTGRSCPHCGTTF